MIHTNELNLDVFPVMSLRHIHLIWYFRVIHVAKEDEIWKIAAKIWEEL